MITSFKTSFFRDVKKAPNSLHLDIDNILSKIDNAQTLKDIPALKKLKGHSTAYRIKINHYRLCFHFENNVVVITRFLPRKDVYRFFP